jgi:mRNA interferase RelE/StbE
MEIRYSKEAIKTLLRIPHTQADLIRRKIEQYATAPETLQANVTQLKGFDGVFRLRVGDWRVIFGKDGEVLNIQKIAPRGSVYG